jgi:hypothetical protein
LTVSESETGTSSSFGLGTVAGMIAGGSHGGGDGRILRAKARGNVALV